LKPVRLNLKIQDTLGTRLALPLVVLIVIFIFGFVCVTAYDYMQNSRKIQQYQDRLARAGKAAAVKKRANTPGFSDKEIKAAHKDFTYLKGVIEKVMIPVPRILDVLERSKPPGLDLTKVAFSDDFRTVFLSGDSALAEDVSQFLLALDRSKMFSAEIIMEKVSDDKKIHFEISAEQEKNDG